MKAFWDVAAHNLGEANRRFRGEYCLYNQEELVYAPLKRRSTSKRLHGAICQKAVSILLVAART
jgi:hypothetical protein